MSEHAAAKLVLPSKAKKPILLRSRKQKILSELNAEQQEAVVNYHGPAFITACPGSGKTRVIVSRAAYMIEEGVPPQSIVLFTFTRKAANEIRDRVASQIGQAASGIMVGTYHSVCGRLLRQYSSYIGYKSNFTIYDEEDRKKMVKKIIENLKIDEVYVMSRISYWKEKMLSPSEASCDTDSKNSDLDTIAIACYGEYQRRMRDANAMDFDDLVYYMVRLLESNQSVRKAVQKRFRFLIADEVQDSSVRDLRLIRLICDCKNICMVGDDEQSIFGFRGADIKAVLNVPEQLGMKCFRLSQNYRSTRIIVEASRSLIRHNKGQVPKDVFTQNGDGVPIAVLELPNQADEANYVTKIIKVMQSKYGFKPNEIAVLYRMGMQAFPIESSLVRNGIAYSLSGGIPFYARKEIKDILSYLKFLYNPRDEQAFLRIVNTPKRGIGNKTIDSILAIASRNPGVSPYMDACLELMESNKKAKDSLQSFYTLTSNLYSDMISLSCTAELVKSVLEKTRYIDSLGEDSEERIANLHSLIGIAESFPTLEDLLLNLSLDGTADDTSEEEKPRVRLMTMHAAKGLEFKGVIIVGANEDVVPHARCQCTPNELDEERRLFYVAMTRAEEMLFITRPKMMMSYGVPKYMKKSRFLQEIDERYLMYQN